MFFEENHFTLSDTMATSIVDISKIDIEELIRNMGKKEAIRMLKQMMCYGTLRTLTFFFFFYLFFLILYFFSFSF